MKLLIFFVQWIQMAGLCLDFHVISDCILSTVSMCLFIYYRNKPAIKATSNILSLCMFVGCYFLLIASLFHTIISGIIIIIQKKQFTLHVPLYD